MKRSTFLFLIACLALIAATYGVLQGGRFYGPLILAMSLLTALAAPLLRLQWIPLLPHIAYGAIDAGLLTLIAAIGGMAFGIVGAVVAAVVGDAFVDTLMETKRHRLDRWRMEHHQRDEDQESLGRTYGKLVGCLIGAGMVLTAFWAAGLPADFIR